MLQLGYDDTFPIYIYIPTKTYAVMGHNTLP